MDKKSIYKLYLKKRQGTCLTPQELEELNKARFVEPDYYAELQSIFSSDVSIEAFNSLDENWYVASLKNPKKRIYQWASVACFFAAIVTIGFVINHFTKVDALPIVAAEVDYEAVIINEATITTEHQSYILSEKADTTYQIDEFEVDATTSNSLEYNNKEKAEVAWHTIKTQVGSQYRLVLADKSVIYLNSNSSVTYPTQFNDSIRKISATGEVFCDISKCVQPFVVELAGTKEIKVLGTQFNVRTYADEAFDEVTLEEGKVQFCDGVNTVDLNPNQQIVIKDDKILVHNVKSHYYSSWRSNMIQFHKVTLKRVLQSVKQLYGVNYKVSKGVDDEMLLICSIDKGCSLNENLQFLEMLTDLKFTKQKEYIIIE